MDEIIRGPFQSESDLKGLPLLPFLLSQQYQQMQ